MKNAKRILCTVLAAALLVAVLLTGCSAPRLTIGGTPDTAGTVGDETISTGMYLAYLYNNFYNMYYSQGLYQYEQYGYDVWSQEYTYGEGDDEQKVTFKEYLKLVTRDSIVRQAVLDDMLAEHKLSWDAEELKELEESIADMEEDAYLPLGISNENFIEVTKKLSLNESGVFYGLYGKGGKREVSEADRRTYFDKNYVSYKIISIALTDDEGSELDEAGQKKITDQLNGYLEKYNKDKNFEAIVDEYNKANAAEGEEVEASKDEDNRVNLDTTQASDEELVKAIRGVDVGKAKVVTYKAGGSTATAALILRLDINSPAELFADETDNILYGMKYEEFNEEVAEAADAKAIELKASVVSKCDPQNFITDLQ